MLTRKGRGRKNQGISRSGRSPIIDQATVEEAKGTIMGICSSRPARDVAAAADQEEAALFACNCNCNACSLDEKRAVVFCRSVSCLLGTDDAGLQRLACTVEGGMTRVDKSDDVGGGGGDLGVGVVVLVVVAPAAATAGCSAFVSEPGLSPLSLVATGSAKDGLSETW